ncbi:MAG: MFS transporter, partial [Chlamydiota bacterium]
LLEGVASGSISVTYATLADISSGRSKAKNFGFLGACWSLGFILGPFAGGYLSSNEVYTFFTYATPFWFAAALSLINLLLVVFLFKETFTPAPKKKIRILQGVINLKKAWELAPLRRMMLAMFIFFLGWETFALFIPIFLIHRFAFDSLDIGNFYAFLGAGFVIGNTLILRLVTHIPAERVLKIGLPLFAIYTVPLMYFSYLPFFLVWLSLIPIVGAVLFALGPIHVSNASRVDEQGEVLGIYQSVQAGSLALPPLIFGSLAAIYPSFSIWGSALFVFLGGLVFWFIKGPKIPKTGPI